MQNWGRYFAPTWGGRATSTIHAIRDVGGWGQHRKYVLLGNYAVSDAVVYGFRKYLSTAVPFIWLLAEEVHSRAEHLTYRVLCTDVDQVIMGHLHEAA